jgi:DinB superfamily
VHPELEQYRQQFEQIASQAQGLAAGLTEAQFNWRPAPDQWSIEECLSHLTMVGQAELLAIEAAIDSAKARGITGSGAFEYPIWERFILRETEPPVRHAMPAPKRFVPLHGQPVTGVLPTFLHVQRNFGIQIARADGLDLRRVKVPTPIVSLLKLSLGSTLAQAAAHERRHIAQARRVRERLP